MLNTNLYRKKKVRASKSLRPTLFSMTARGSTMNSEFEEEDRFMAESMNYSKSRLQTEGDSPKKR